MAVRRDWELAYGVDDVLRSQGADPRVIRSRRPQLVEVARRALEIGKALIEPAVLTRRLAVQSLRHNRATLEEGVTLTGPLITEHLGGAESIVVMLCTIGERLDLEAARRSADDLGLALAIDGVGSAAVHALSAAACNVVEGEARAADLQTSLPLSPGMEGWDVDPGQREVFAMIDPDPIGVVLSPSLEMRPLKSTTSIIGVGESIAIKGAICDYCAMNDTCQHKIA